VTADVRADPAPPSEEAPAIAMPGSPVAAVPASAMPSVGRAPILPAPAAGVVRAAVARTTNDPGPSASGHPTTGTRDETNDIGLTAGGGAAVPGAGVSGKRAGESAAAAVEATGTRPTTENDVLTAGVPMGAATESDAADGLSAAGASGPTAAVSAAGAGVFAAGTARQAATGNGPLAAGAGQTSGVPDVGPFAAGASGRAAAVPTAGDGSLAAVPDAADDVLAAGVTGRAVGASAVAGGVLAVVSDAGDGIRAPEQGLATPAAGGTPLAVEPLEHTLASRFLDALADRIALGVASVVAVLDPGCVVLGGEVGQAGGVELAGRVEGRIRGMAPLVTEVRASGLGGGAVLRGALLTAREAAQAELFGTP